MSDLISRQAAIDEKIRCAMCRNTMKTDRGCDGNCSVDENLYKEIVRIIEECLPSAQPEEAIPVSWIEAIIKKFMMADDAFSSLTASIIRVMLNEWKKEKERRTDGSD